MILLSYDDSCLMMMLSDGRLVSRCSCLGQVLQSHFDGVHAAMMSRPLLGLSCLAFGLFVPVSCRVVAYLRLCLFFLFVFCRCLCFAFAHAVMLSINAFARFL